MKKGVYATGAILAMTVLLVAVSGNAQTDDDQVYKGQEGMPGPQVIEKIEQQDESESASKGWKNKPYRKRRRMRGYGMEPGMMRGYGYGMGPGMMGGYGMGPGMMMHSYGMGPGMMNYGMHPGMMKRGYGMGPGMMGFGGYRSGWGGCGAYSGGDGYSAEQREKFLNDTTELRRKMHVLMFDYGEAQRDPETDSEVLRNMEKEMSELRQEIIVKSSQ